MSAADTLIGKNLRLVRKSRGLTQAELGARLEITGSAVGYIERGRKRISAAKLVQAAKALGFPVAQFFEGVE